MSCPVFFLCPSTKSLILISKKGPKSVARGHWVMGDGDGSMVGCWIDGLCWGDNKQNTLTFSGTPVDPYGHVRFSSLFWFSFEGSKMLQVNPSKDGRNLFHPSGLVQVDPTQCFSARFCEIGTLGIQMTLTSSTWQNDFSMAKVWRFWRSWGQPKSFSIQSKKSVIEASKSWCFDRWTGRITFILWITMVRVWHDMNVQRIPNYIVTLIWVPCWLPKFWSVASSVFKDPLTLTLASFVRQTTTSYWLVYHLQ